MQEQVFFPQLLEQLRTIFRRKAGAEPCSIRFGLRNLPSLILQMTHPQLVANNMLPLVVDPSAMEYSSICSWGRRSGGI